MEEALLQEILLSREERVLRQDRMRKRFSSAILSFTLNIAGPIKTSPLILRAFREGRKILLSLFSPKEILEMQSWEEKTGPLLILALSLPAEEIKKRCLPVEEEHPLGRLFDFDVLSPWGEKISRKVPRRCLICEEDAFFCSSRRHHSVEELQKKTNEILVSFFLKKDAAHLAELCHASLLFELHTTPKPGLVDENNNGSHADMDLPMFEKSAEALFPLWEASFRLGFETRGALPEEIFLSLRALGLEAEQKMLSKTKGVNTHKGALFSFCLFCAAAGSVYNGAALPSVSEICEAVKPIASVSLLDYEKSGGAPPLTGARGEAALGFPSAREVALPILKSLFAEGASSHTAGGVALLCLIAIGRDTNLVSRGGAEGAAWAKARVQALLERNPVPTKEEMLELDEEFIRKNLSPGGSADLLALSFLMYQIEKDV